MATLFPLEPDFDVSLPDLPGLRYLPNYISVNEETALIVEIDSQQWNTAWQRRRQLYGASYGRAEGEPRPMPAWGKNLAQRMLAAGITHQFFDQLLVNEYQPGQGIAMHRDYQTFGDTVVSLSLLSHCVMTLFHPTEKRREQLLLQRRSLLVLSGPARHQWQHGIAARKNDTWQGVKLTRYRRVSVTLRTTKV